MNTSYVLLDRDIIDVGCKLCLEHAKIDEENKHVSNLLLYLEYLKKLEMSKQIETAPFTGLISSRTREIIIERYSESSGKISQRKYRIVQEFDEMTEKFLRTEGINHNELLANRKKVDDYFNDLVGPPPATSSYYAKLVNNSFRKPKLQIGNSERESFAEAFTLKPKIKELRFFASLNPVFSQPFIVNKIEEDFDITSGDVNSILDDMKKQSFI